jgi:hypothetical protein
LWGIARLVVKSGQRSRRGEEDLRSHAQLQFHWHGHRLLGVTVRLTDEFHSFIDYQYLLVWYSIAFLRITHLGLPFTNEKRECPGVNTWGST